MNTKNKAVCPTDYKLDNKGTLIEVKCMFNPEEV